MASTPSGQIASGGTSSEDYHITFAGGVCSWNSWVFWRAATPLECGDWCRFGVFGWVAQNPKAAPVAALQKLAPFRRLHTKLTRAHRGRREVSGQQADYEERQHATRRGRRRGKVQSPALGIGRIQPA